MTVIFGLHNLRLGKTMSCKAEAFARTLYCNPALARTNLVAEVALWREHCVAKSVPWLSDSLLRYIWLGKRLWLSAVPLARALSCKTFVLITLSLGRTFVFAGLPGCRRLRHRQILGPQVLRTSKQLRLFNFGSCKDLALLNLSLDRRLGLQISRLGEYLGLHNLHLPKQHWLQSFWYYKNPGSHDGKVQTRSTKIVACRCD